MTVEGAPHLKDEHLPVFDTANKCGKKGTRFIHHMGHILMMAAAQSFLSGAISKTINMPNEATVDDIIDAYMRVWVAWAQGDGALPRWFQVSQPLSSKSDSKVEDDDDVEDKLRRVRSLRSRRPSGSASDTRPSPTRSPEAKLAWEPEQAAKRRPSCGGDRRWSTAGSSASSRERHAAGCRPDARFTQEARVAGQKVYLRTGEYDDGTLGEIFIDMPRKARPSAR